MDYFNTIVLAVATLMEPILASFIAVACNAGLLVSKPYTLLRSAAGNHRISLHCRLLAWTAWLVGKRIGRSRDHERHRTFRGQRGRSCGTLDKMYYVGEGDNAFSFSNLITLRFKKSSVCGDS
jgi:hypothetical protein